MNIELLTINLFNPPILFFFLGVLACLFKSDLDIPQPLPKLFSIYLLIAIGFKGGVELNKNGLNSSVLSLLFISFVMSSIIPIYSFYILKKKLDFHNAAAIAATYGSVSAVTFITAGTYINKMGFEYGGYMIAAMAFMESPAIIISVMLLRMYYKDPQQSHEISTKELFKDALLNGSVVLLLGSMVIGFITGESGKVKLEPFIYHIFTGMLCIFLLDMGLAAARRLGDLKKTGAFLILFGLITPVFNGLLGLTLAYLIQLQAGDAFMFMVLSSGASYIAVPAAMRLAIPQANPSLYVPMALAITFPFNIILGLPIYLQLVNYFW